MIGLGWIGRLVLIGAPFFWLVLFFLLPLYWFLFNKVIL